MQEAVQSIDTIVAPATPTGTSALAIVRVSGPQSASLFTAIFGKKEPRERHAIYSNYHSLNGNLIDEVVVTYFKNPHSFTGEDSLEISTHGNPLIVQKVIQDLIARGCRLAETGEFSRRAFLNGRIDLSQAEAIMDLIHARSERAMKVANEQLKGSLGKHLQSLIDPLLGVIAEIEAHIDFPEEDLPEENLGKLRQETENVLRGTRRLLSTQQYGELLRDGIRTVIIGAPNTGKSSILNRLVGYDRAIVSQEAGTTRDFIEERINIGEHSLRLIDTAGLNPHPGEIERIGMEKTLERAAEAHLFLWVVDATLPRPTLPDSVQALLSSQNTLLLQNKSDLLPQDVDFADGAEAPVGPTGFEPTTPTLSISALTGEGFDALNEEITKFANRFLENHGDELITINARHAEALGRARESLEAALGKIRDGIPSPELLASDLRGALDALGEIAGRVDNERMLDVLFARFCIGK